MGKAFQERVKNNPQKSSSTISKTNKKKTTSYSKNGLKQKKDKAWELSQFNSDDDDDDDDDNSKNKNIKKPKTYRDQIGDYNDDDDDDNDDDDNGDQNEYDHGNYDELGSEEGNESDYDNEDNNQNFVSEDENEENENSNDDDDLDLSDMPLYERLQLLAEREIQKSSSNKRGDSIIGNRKRLRHKKRVNAEPNNDENKDDDNEPKMGKNGGRSHKNAPAVQMSNRPVRRLRDNSIAKQPKSLDPRFSELNGKLNHDKFLQSFSFLDKYQEDEVSKLSRTMQKSKSMERKADLKSELLP
jgi:hypothetical protein